MSHPNRTLNNGGYFTSKGDKIDRAWREHLNQALAVLHTLREPDEAMAEAGDAGVWRAMVETAIAEAEQEAAP